jgi:hypothetical protein
MNLKIVWALLFVSLLSVSLAVSIHAVIAESTSSTSYSVVKILSPTNTTYNSRCLTLNVTFPASALQYTLTYSIDGKNQGSIPWAIDNPNNELHVVYTAIGTVALPELSEGSHCITAKIVCGLYDFHGTNPPGAPFKPTSPGSSDYEASWIDTVYFTIDSSAGTPEPALELDSVPPNISDISLDNGTYTSGEVALNFTVDEKISQAMYSLDGTGNITIAGNTTLTGLSVGAHNLTIYAWDIAGNVGASKTVKFDVASMTAEAEPQESFLTALVVAVPLAVVAFFAMEILVYFRKRKPADVK